MPRTRPGRDERQVGPDLDAAFAQARADGMDNDTIEGVVQTQIESPRYVEEGAPNYDRGLHAGPGARWPRRRARATYVASVAAVPSGSAAAAGETAEQVLDEALEVLGRQRGLEVLGMIPAE